MKKREPDEFSVSDPPPAPPFEPPGLPPTARAVPLATIARLRMLCVEVTRIDRGGGVGALAAELLAELEE